MPETYTFPPEAVPLLLDWYRESRRDLPWREDRDAYRVLVSEIMLQQTRAETVKPYFHRFLAALPTIDDLAAVEEATLLKLWEGLGYYSRARNLKRAAEAVVREHGGVIPADFDALLALPGVGRYTAGAVASIAYDIPVPAVDGNVLRVMARLLGNDTDVLSPAAKATAEAVLAPHVPSPGAGDFTQSLIELGALVCTPGAEPKCEACPLRLLCVAAREGRQGELPVRVSKTKRRVEERTVLVIRTGGDEVRVALRRRPDTGLLAGLWEFPCLDGFADEAAVRTYLGEMGLTVADEPDAADSNAADSNAVVVLPEAKHLFSHIEWRMRGYAVTIEKPNGVVADWIFAPLRALDEVYAVPSAYATYRPWAVR